MKRLSIALMLCLLATPGPGWAQSMLGVLCRGDATIHLVDVRSIRETGKIGPLACSPRTIAASRDGRLLAVGGLDDTIRLFDLPSGRPDRTLQSPYFEHPAALEFSPTGSLLVISKGVKALVEVSIPSGKVTRVLPLVGPEPLSMEPTPAGHLLVLQRGGWLSEVDPTSWKIVRQDSFLNKFGGAAEVGQRLLVSLPMKSVVRVLDGPTRETVANIQAGAGPGRVVLSHNGSLAVVLDQLSNDVMAIDVATAKLQWGAKVGQQPADAVFSPDGRWLYVANSASNDLSVVDVKSARELGRLPLGKDPSRVIWIPAPGAPSPASYSR